MSHPNISSSELDQQFYKEYTSKMIRNGRLTTFFAALLTFLPALYLWIALGYKPTWGQIGAGWANIFAAYAIIYIVEPLSFYPVMGLSGIYIGYLAGNIPSVRLPAMMAAQASTGAEAGTKRGELVGTIAIGSSVFVNIVFVTIAAIAGTAILSVLPQFAIKAFDYTLPAILGGVIGQYFMKNKPFVVIILILCLIIQIAPMASILKFPGAVLSSFIIGYLQYQSIKAKRLKKELKKSETENSSNI